MKKLFVLALGCGVAFTAIACSESDEDLALRACRHKVECEVPLYTEDTCNAMEKSNSNNTNNSEEPKLSKECLDAQRALAECEADAKCEDLKGGTACLTEVAKTTKICLEDLFN